MAYPSPRLRMALIWLVDSVICLGTALLACSVQDAPPCSVPEETSGPANPPPSFPAEMELAAEVPAVAIEGLPVYQPPAPSALS